MDRVSAVHFGVMERLAGMLLPPEACTKTLVAIPNQRLNPTSPGARMPQEWAHHEEHLVLNERVTKRVYQTHAKTAVPS